ncbi:phenolic glucoside malonyltransferase 2-like [Oryza brachyantha]|uniref:phenolic glucoside malonyltransferase 2-like n=1 Tax=Oryza brachyantha TaxID=4533 RepID=UPI001ADD1D59|nr:phenolic glucoside malonyltransferase 2-like [Oryza brachyantha]
MELDSHRIADIKNRIAELDEEAATTTSPGRERRLLPSTFVAVSAVVWSSVVRARSPPQRDDGAGAGAGDASTHLVFPADCRPRLDPPVDVAYFGNCVRGCAASAAARELAEAPRGVLRVRDAIRSAVDGFAERPMEAFDTWLDAVGAMLRQPGFVAVTASPRFRPYDAGGVRVREHARGHGGGDRREEGGEHACLGVSPPGAHGPAFRSQLLDW